MKQFSLLSLTLAVASSASAAPYFDALTLSSTFEMDPVYAATNRVPKIGRLRIANGPMNITLRFNARSFDAIRGKGELEISQASGLVRARLAYLPARQTVENTKYLLLNSVLISDKQSVPVSLSFNVNRTLKRADVTEERVQWCGRECRGGSAGAILCTPFGCFGLGGSARSCKDLGYRRVDVTFDEYSATADVELISRLGARVGQMKTAFIGDSIQLVSRREYVGECSTSLTPVSVSGASSRMAGSYAVDPVAGEPIASLTDPVPVQTPVESEEKFTPINEEF